MKNSITSVMHETAKGLQDAGVMTDFTMRKFDVLCLPKVEELAPNQITEHQNAWQIAEIEQALREADAGDFASDAEVSASWENLAKSEK
jgi:DNA-binding transcriptional regulator YiaG